MFPASTDPRPAGFAPGRISVFAALRIRALLVARQIVHVDGARARGGWTQMLSAARVMHGDSGLRLRHALVEDNALPRKETRMPTNPPENMPRITPNVFYDDIGAALDWLGKAFGFETRMSLPGPEQWG